MNGEKPHHQDRALKAEEPSVTAATTSPQIFVIATNSNPPLERQASSTTGDDAEETYPEGGLRAWLVVLGCWLALVAGLGLMNTLATLQTYVATHQLAEYEEGTIGWVFSTYTFVVFFLGIYIGPLFDKYGPRWLVFAGTVSLVTSLMLLSICTDLWHFILTFGVFSGFGCSLLFTPSFAAIGHFFKERRGLATGVASTGGSIGGIVFPLMLEGLFGRVGFAWAIRILAFVCLALCIAANFLIRSRLPPLKNASAHPDFTIFKNTPFLLTTISMFLMEFALFIPLTYISSYAQAQGFTKAFSFQILPILNAASAFGRALPGYWADVIGPFNINIIMLTFCTIACLAIWLPAGAYTAGLVLFAVAFGFGSGSNVSITPVCVGRLCKTQEYGRYYATCYTVVSFGCLVGVPIGGNILASNGGDYWGMVVLTGMIYIGSLVFLYAAKVSCVGWRFAEIF